MLVQKAILLVHLVARLVVRLVLRLTYGGEHVPEEPRVVEAAQLEDGEAGQVGGLEALGSMVWCGGRPLTRALSMAVHRVSSSSRGRDRASSSSWEGFDTWGGAR